MRWRPRFIWRSVSDHLYDGLAASNWPMYRPGATPPTPPAWVENPVRWLEDQPEEVAGGAPVTPNTVGITIGDSGTYVPEEMGAQVDRGLHSMDIPIFVDVYGENRSTSLSLASDICDIVAGRLWAPSPFVPIYDYTSSPRTLVVDEACEIVQVSSEWPQVADATTVAWKRNWRVVRFTAVCYFTS